MTIYEKVWYEMLDAKMREAYTIAYLKRQRNIKRWYKIATLFFSTSGILGWSYFQNPVFGIFTSGMVSIISVFQLIEGQLFHSDEHIDCLSQMPRLHSNYCLAIEQIFFQMCNSEISDQEAAKEFFAISKNYDNELHEISKRISITIHNKMKFKAEAESKSHFERYNK